MVFDLINEVLLKFAQDTMPMANCVDRMQSAEFTTA